MKENAKDFLLGQGVYIGTFPPILIQKYRAKIVKILSAPEPGDIFFWGKETGKIITHILLSIGDNKIAHTCNGKLHIVKYDHLLHYAKEQRREFANSLSLQSYVDFRDRKKVWLKDIIGNSKWFDE